MMKEIKGDSSTDQVAQLIKSTSASIPVSKDQEAIPQNFLTLDLESLKESGLRIKPLLYWNNGFIVKARKPQRLGSSIIRKVPANGG